MDAVLNFVGKEAEEEHRICLKHLSEGGRSSDRISLLLKQLQKLSSIAESKTHFLTKQIKCTYMMKVDYMYLFQS